MSAVNPYETPRGREGSAVSISSEGASSIRSFVTEEDMVAFHAHYTFRTPAGRQARRRRWVIGLPLTGIGIFGLIQFPRDELWLLHFFMLIMGVTIFVTTSRPFALWMIRRGVRALLAAGRNVLAYGEQTIKLGADDFVRDTPWSHSSVKWSALERIDVTRDYLFVFYSINVGTIIPARDFDSPESFQAFADTAVQRFAEHNRSLTA